MFQNSSILFPKKTFFDLFFKKNFFWEFVPVQRPYFRPKKILINLMEAFDTGYYRKKILKKT
jgi:hypothetical protein